MSRAQRAWRLCAGVLLLGGGLIAVGYVAHVVVDARSYQAVERRRFEATRRAVAEPGLPGAALRPGEGDSIGELRIPRLGLSAIIAQGDSAAVLHRAVGHLAETALPGEPGNVVLAAHRDTFFRPLERVRVGDAITVRTARGDFAYVVEWTAVMRPSDVQVIEPTDHDVLTLVTCFPFSYLGAAPSRFIVRARAATTSTCSRRAGCVVPAAVRLGTAARPAYR